ncbi:hypothetical protein [Gilliamella sp. CG16]|uniref:hypothetical protein n=1 Tax=Gilliamella sp. CG16 TaxID=3351503 RepID=UPI0039876958
MAISKITGDIKVFIKERMSPAFGYVPANYFEKVYTIQVVQAEEQYFIDYDSKCD